MTRTCESCGEEFDTLSGLRVHQLECDEADEHVELDDDVGLEGAVEQAVDKLLVCDVCEADVDGARNMSTDETDAGLAVDVEFTCDDCGALNQNTAILA